MLPLCPGLLRGCLCFSGVQLFCLGPVTFLRKPHIVCVFFPLLPPLSYQHPLLESDAGKKARSFFMWKVIFSLHYYFVVNQTLHFGPKLCVHVGKGRPPEATGDIVQELCCCAAAAAAAWRRAITVKCPKHTPVFF